MRAETTFCAILALAITAGLSILFPHHRIIFVCIGALILIGIIAADIAFRPRIFRQGDDRREVLTGVIRFPSRCVMLTDCWDGRRQYTVDKVAEVMTYCIGIDSEGVVRSLLLDDPTRGGVGGAERVTVSVDTEVLVIVCCDAFTSLRESDNLRRAVMDLVDNIASGARQRYSLLTLGGDNVGLVFMPSEGNGIYEFSIRRAGELCVRVAGDFCDDDRSMKC